MADPIPWTFAVGGEISEQLDPLTDILPSATGSEQRRGLRSAPRTTLQFDGLDSDAAHRYLENLLHAHGAGPWHVPFAMDRGQLTAPLTSGAAAIPIDTRWRHYTAGGKAMLLGPSPRQCELVDIDTVEDSQLILDGETVQAWPAGTLVFPTAVGRLDSVPTLSRFTVSAAPYTPRFVLDGPIDWPADAGGATYRDVPVLELVSDWSEDPTWQPDRQVTIVDYGTSVPMQFDLVGISLGLATRTFTLTTMERIAAFRSLLYALNGRRCPIWVPSMARDLVVTSAVENGASTLDVEWCGISQRPMIEGRRDIRIQLFGGTIHYRRITASVALNSMTERLTLDAEIDTGFAANQVELVSFLVPCRQEADTTVLRWWSFGVVRADLSFRGVKDDL